MQQVCRAPTSSLSFSLCLFSPGLPEPQVGCFSCLQDWHARERVMDGSRALVICQQQMACITHTNQNQKTPKKLAVSVLQLELQTHEKYLLLVRGDPFLSPAMVCKRYCHFIPKWYSHMVSAKQRKYYILLMVGFYFFELVWQARSSQGWSCWCRGNHSDGLPQPSLACVYNHTVANRW